VTLGSPTDGKAEIRRRLQNRRVLICLDDVWEDASIAMDVDDFGTGSHILKTSRVKEAIGGVTYNLDVLDKELAGSCSVGMPLVVIGRRALLLTAQRRPHTGAEVCRSL
jgi:hypothetical protein